MIYVLIALIIVAVYLIGAAGTYRWYMSTMSPHPALRWREEKDAMLMAFIWPLFWIIMGFLFLAAGLQKSIRYLSGVK